MKTIDNLPELLKAIKSEKVINDGYPNIIRVDNDVVSMWNGIELDDEGEELTDGEYVFSMHPSKLLEELLEHVGLKWEAV